MGEREEWLNVLSDSEFAELERPWPRFMDLLDTQPEMAREQFMSLAFRYLEARPPGIFLNCWYYEPLDFSIEVVRHLVDSKFKRLRKYENTGGKFAYWLRRVARNRAQDLIRERMQGDRREVGGATGDEFGSEGTARGVLAVGPGQAKFRAAQATPIDGALVERVLQAIESFRGTLCYCLLSWRLLRDYDNQEITRILGWPPEENGKVGNRFRTCRIKLTERLADLGITEKDLLAS
jgi:DNA-directed RNA polymerase specialized sigma24 family protein